MVVIVAPSVKTRVVFANPSAEIYSAGEGDLIVKTTFPSNQAIEDHPHLPQAWPCCRLSQVHLGRRSISQSLMKPFMVVQPDVAAQPHLQLWHCPISLDVDVLVLHTAPQQLHKDVVENPTSATYADGYPCPLQPAPWSQLVSSDS